MNPPTLLVRADANKVIGSGHFMRCLALAQAWHEQGGKAIFLMATGSSGLEKRLEDDNIGRVRLSSPAGSDDDANETAAAALRQQAEWVALDGYHFSPEYQYRLKEKAAHLLIFDDLGDSDQYHADLLLNQNAYATPAMYGNRAGDCKLLLGARYQLLRREFRHRGSGTRLFPDKASNLLVTFGGSDPENVTAKALQALAIVSAMPMQVRVLVGASNPHRAELEQLAGRLRHSIEFETDSKRMGEQMRLADLAISASGSTSWELAYMGLPSLLITLSDNQKGCAQYLHHNKIANSLGWHDQVRPEDIASALQELSNDPERRAEMSARGRALIDGRGGERVVQAMAAVYGDKQRRRAPLIS